RRLGRLDSGLGQAALQGGRRGLQAVQDQRLLGGEVVEDRLLRYPARLGDLRHADRVEAPLHEHPGRRIGQLLAHQPLLALPQPPAKVWRAVTDPALVPLWTATGAGGRPEGFAPVVGTKFRFLAKPKPGWSGIVDCEVLEVNEPSLLRYSWTGDEGGDVTEVVYRLEPHAGGTRFTYDHTGFTGVGGVFMAKLLGHVRRKMLRVGLPPVLD